MTNQFTTTTVLITPELAKQYLSTMAKNRKVNPKRVDLYANDMLSSRWLLTHTGLAFDYNGCLIDGQHRLLAVIKANARVTMTVTTGLSPEAFSVIDIGQPRSGGQVATLSGIPNGKKIMEVISHVSIIQRSEGRANINASTVASMTIADRLEFYRINSEALQHSLNLAQSSWRRCRSLSVTVLAAVHFLASRKNAALADLFAIKLGTGEGLIKGNPCYALREKMIDRSSRKVKETIYQVSELHVIAWNAYANGRSLKLLKFAKDVSVPKVI